MKSIESPQTIIHIGYPKCASTFLGKNIFPNLDVDFIRMRDRPEFRKITNYCTKKKDFDPSVLNSWFARCKKKSLNTTILSFSGFSGDAEGTIKDIDSFIIANNLKLSFPKAKILILIRNQLKYITSLYAFRVTLKGLETRTFEAFLAQEGEKGLFNKLEYHNLIGHYINLFGNNNVLVLPVEILAKNSHEFIKKIGEFSCLDINGEEILSMAMSRPTSNRSTKDKNIINFMRMVNTLFKFIISKQKYIGVHIGHRYYKSKEKIIPLVDSFLGDNKQTIQIPSEIERQLLERYKMSNLHLQSMTNIELSEYGY